MASVQYISIIRLFRHCEIDTGISFNVTRAKKQLQAEFNIAANGFITVDGFHYSRQDVFAEIERPDFITRLDFHLFIWNHPHLLNLLEKNATDLSSLEADLAEVSNNSEFDAFFSVYFAGPFIYLCRTFLSQLNMKNLGELLRFEPFLQAGEREEAFRPIRTFLIENLRLLRNINKENYSMMRPKIAHWIDTDWHVFFNQLPDEFYEEKNSITVLLINIGVAIQKSHRRDCRKMSQQLVSLADTPESVREIVVSNHAVYNGAGSSSSISWWKSAGALFWIIFILIRFVASDGCNDRSSRPNFKYNTIQYRLADSSVRIVPEVEAPRFFDSLQKQAAENLKKIRLQIQANDTTNAFSK